MPCSRSAFLARGFAGDTQDQPECGTAIAQPGTEFCSQAEMPEFVPLALPVVANLY